MIQKKIMRLLDKKTKMTGWMLAQELGAAAAIGAAAGIFITERIFKINRAESGTMTLELRDLDRLKIERIE